MSHKVHCDPCGKVLEWEGDEPVSYAIVSFKDADPYRGRSRMAERHVCMDCLDLAEEAFAMMRERRDGTVNFRHVTPEWYRARDWP